MLGTQVCVRVESAAATAAIDRLLAPFRCRAAVNLEHVYALTRAGLHRDHDLMLQTDSLPMQVNWLLSDLNRAAVEGFGGFAVHAGVVARGDRVVAFPAASGEGKSTLTAACLAAGFRYVSDEALCIDFEDDAVLPYPKPLKLSRHAARLVGLEMTGTGEQEGEVEGEVAVPPEDLGAGVARGALRLGHVVSLVRRPGAPAVRPLDRSETVVLLLAMSFNHYRHPPACFSLATRLAAASTAYRLEYDDPQLAASLLRDLVDAEHNPAQDRGFTGRREG